MRYNLLIFANNDIFIVYEKILYVATYNNFIIDSGGELFFSIKEEFCLVILRPIVICCFKMY